MPVPSEHTTVGSLLIAARQRLSLLHGPDGAKAITRAWVQDRLALAVPELERERTIPAGQIHLLDKDLDRLAAGEPLQYVLGRVEFHRLRIAVDPRVLIPRPETEELVELIIRSCAKVPDRIVDVGTGSGCIALALKQAFPSAQVIGVDISEAALELAGENASANGLEVQWIKANALGEELPGLMQSMLSGPGNLVVSNPPYVPRSDSSAMQAQVLDHEPHLALFVDNSDPHCFFRAIASAAAPSFHPGDALWFEGHYRHAPETVQVVVDAGFPHAEMIADLSGNPRFIHAWV
ncbi:MAG: peptide chain release factor N(5)-glutamine methyltransferase [Flavobacteriales bacterium]|nr:peptide chain release factor N(5)-glutamine methyltransferase [Flavobacteriales bacterium]